METTKKSNNNTNKLLDKKLTSVLNELIEKNKQFEIEYPNYIKELKRELLKLTIAKIKLTILDI